MTDPTVFRFHVLDTPLISHRQHSINPPTLHSFARIFRYLPEPIAFKRHRYEISSTNPDPSSEHWKTASGSLSFAIFSCMRAGPTTSKKVRYASFRSDSEPNLDSEQCHTFIITPHHPYSLNFAIILLSNSLCVSSIAKVYSQVQSSLPSSFNPSKSARKLLRI